MFKYQFAVAIVGVLFYGVTANAQKINAPEQVTIENLVYAGTGCIAGSVAENIAEDNTAFTLLFDSFVAEIGPGISRRESRKFCQLNMELSHSAGWSFAILDLNTRGYVGLDRNVEALQKTSFYFQGSPVTGEVEESFVGFLDDDYESNHIIPADQANWSPCGESRSLNVKTQVRLNNSHNRRGTGIITADSLDGQMYTTFGLVWKQCPSVGKF